MQSVRVLILDSSLEASAQIVRILQDEPRIEVVGAARSGRTCLRMMEIFHPQVLIADLDLPEGPLASFLRQLPIRGSEIAVLVVSPRAARGVPDLDAAVGAGASDFIQRPEDPESFGRLGRLLITKVMVLGVTRGGGGSRPVPGPSDAARARFRTRTMLFIAGAPGRVDDLEKLVAAAGREPRSPTVVWTGQELPAARRMAEELETLFEIPATVVTPPTFIHPGRTYLIPALPRDLKVDLDPGGRFRFWPCERDRPEKGLITLGPEERAPSVTRLLHSMSQLAGRSMVAILLGGAPAPAIRGLAYVADRDGYTALESGHQREFGTPTREITPLPVPRETIELEQIRALLRG